MKTWHLKDIRKIGLKRNLPKFISNFLSNRCFKVKVGSSFSDVYEQEQGVPQGDQAKSLGVIFDKKTLLFPTLIL